MNRLLLSLFITFLSFAASAQLLTWTPDFPKENDAAQNLVITVDASKGNAGLLNYTPTSDVYVHTGVITNLSTSSGDWKYVKFSQNFNQPNAQLQATYLGNNKWQFTIAGSLRSYYGITNTSETIQKIAILFRNGVGSKKQANSDGSDMYIPVYDNSLSVRLNLPAREPRFVPVPETQTWIVGTSFTVQAAASKASTLKLYHNNVVIATATNAQTVSGTSTVTVQGQQQVVAEAFDGTTTKYDTLNVFVAPTTSPVAALPAGVRDGINYESDGTVATLVLHAPGKSLITVLGDFNNWTQGLNYIMNKTPDGKKFWLRLTGLTAGKEYAFQYNVDDTLRIADPYAEKVLDPYNDGSIPAATYPNLLAYPTGKTTGVVSVLQTAQTPYNWTTTNFSRPDKRGLVVYELLVRDFVANHNWSTLKDTLNYLKNLGINAIEIMPFNEFEGNLSWGYNSDFYFAPDKYYGPKNTLKDFVDACHSKGIAVIMDVALNHQFGLSPLVQLYFDKTNNQPAPNNPWFNPVATHPFNVGYDMNHESLDTRYFTSRVIEYWLTEYKLDGFRFDLSKGFTQKNSGTDVNAWSAYDASRIAIWKRYYDTVQTKSSGAYAILEHFAANDEEKELAAYGMMLWNNLNYNYNEASMGYVGTSDFSGAVHTTRGFTQPNLVTYMESHDEERLQFKNENYGNSSGSYTVKDTATGLKRIEMDAAFFFTIPGPKMIWQFGELGYDYSINACENGTINNDCRTNPKPIRWDYLTQARRKHVYDEFSSLIKLRFHPWYQAAFLSNRVDQSLTGAFKWIKVTTDTSNLLVVGNFDVAATTGTVTFQNAGTWYDYLGGTTFSATGSSQSITLQPGEFHVYINRNVTNTTTTPVSSIPINSSMLAASVFPNPVAGSFTVDVNLPQSGPVQVAVLNVLGQQSALLYDAFQTKGQHQFSFSRTAIKTKGGAYYLRVTTKEGIKTVPITVQ